MIFLASAIICILVAGFVFGMSLLVREIATAEERETES